MRESMLIITIILSLLTLVLLLYLTTTLGPRQPFG
jgi:hypothetical protein